MPERLPPKPATSAGQLISSASAPTGRGYYSVLRADAGAEGHRRGPVPLGAGERRGVEPEGAVQRPPLLHAKDAEACIDCGPLPHRGAPAPVCRAQRPLAGRARASGGVRAARPVPARLRHAGAARRRGPANRLRAAQGAAAGGRASSTPAASASYPSPPPHRAGHQPERGGGDDFLRVLHREVSRSPVLIVPARVQGEGAAQEMARGMSAPRQPRVDVVVVVARRGQPGGPLGLQRGGGGARSLRLPGPTVSAVGHETDVTIADFSPTCARRRRPRPPADRAGEGRALGGPRPAPRAPAQGVRAQLERKRGQHDKLRSRVRIRGG